MTLRRAVGLRTLRSVFAVVAALLAVLAAPVRARSGAAPLHAVVEPATARDGWFIFPVRVLAEGGPVLVVMPSYTGLARLEVNGALRARAGSNFINVGPFGHGVTTFRLADVHPRDRVVIETNSAGMPRVVEAYDFPVRTFCVGFLEGAYYAVFLTVAIIQLAAFLRTRDTFRLWYVAFVASLVGCELARDGGVLGMS